MHCTGCVLRFACSSSLIILQLVLSVWLLNFSKWSSHLMVISIGGRILMSRVDSLKVGPWNVSTCPTLFICSAYVLIVIDWISSLAPCVWCVKLNFVPVKLLVLKECIHIIDTYNLVTSCFLSLLPAVIDKLQLHWTYIQAKVGSHCSPLH